MNSTQNKLWLLGWSIMIVLLTGCTNYDKLVKSSDISKKLTAANAYYDQKKYTKANGLYESLISVLKGTKNFEAVYYRYAYTFYYNKQYLSASYNFKNFLDFFPNSPLAEEVEYRHLEMLYKMSNSVHLDQTSTGVAIQSIEAFLEKYPNSKYKDSAQVLLLDGLAKIEEHDANAAKLYYNLGYYKSAVVYYNDLLRRYPHSLSQDYYQFMMMRSNYMYAKASIAEKQLERYQLAQRNYLDLKNNYPNSKYLAEAQSIVANVESKIKNLSK